MPGQIFIISAPSGTGKTTIINKVLSELDHCRLSISHTTRKPRKHEKNARDYFFISRTAFERMVDASEFVEHASVFGNYYGTSRKQVKRAQKEGIDLLLDIDVQGARQIRKSLKGTISIFMLPPSMKILHKRLKGRATEDQDDLKRRLKRAETEIKKCQSYDYLIFNDDIERAAQALKSIIIAEGLKTRRAFPRLKRKYALA